VRPFDDEPDECHDDGEAGQKDNENVKPISPRMLSVHVILLTVTCDIPACEIVLIVPTPLWRA
jgi:hypothetical protein